MCANPQKENGHLDLANELVDKFARTRLSNYEWRIIWVLLRKTYSWHKKSDWIALKQFIEMTGLQRPHICRAIRMLLEQNIITKGGTNQKPVYSFQKNYDSWKALPKGARSHSTKRGTIDVTNRGNEHYQSGQRALPKGVTVTGTTKEPVTKETVTKETTTIVVGDKSRVDKRNPELQKVIDYAKSKNFSLQGSEKINRQYAFNLIRKKDDKGQIIGSDRVVWLIDACAVCRGKRYAPQINDFKSLFYKWQDLINFIGKEKNVKRGIRL